MPAYIRATCALTVFMLIAAEARPAPGLSLPGGPVLIPLSDDNAGNTRPGKEIRDKSDKSSDKSASDKSAKDNLTTSGEGPGATDEEKKRTSRRQEKILPLEIVAPLLDVSIVVDEGQRAARVLRGG